MWKENLFVLFPLPSTVPKCVKLSGSSSLKSSITMSYGYLLTCVGDVLIYLVFLNIDSYAHFFFLHFPVQTVILKFETDDMVRIK